MKRTSLITGAIALAILGGALPVSAQPQDPCFPATIVVPAGEVRAALESSNGGLWTFSLAEVKGNVSRVDIQFYENALPTSGQIADLFAVCASYPDPYGRPQASCSQGMPEPGRISSAGSLSIKRVKAGATASISLEAGVYCVRVAAGGKGTVAVSINPQ